MNSIAHSYFMFTVVLTNVKKVYNFIASVIYYKTSAKSIHAPAIFEIIITKNIQ